MTPVLLSVLPSFQRIKFLMCTRRSIGASAAPLPALGTGTRRAAVSLRLLSRGWPSPVGPGSSF